MQSCLLYALFVDNTPGFRRQYAHLETPSKVTAWCARNSPLTVHLSTFTFAPTLDRFRGIWCRPWPTAV